MGATLDELIARVNDLAPEERAELVATARAETAGMLWVPNDGPQTDAYFSEADELFFGGQPGGGKSDLLLGLALNEPAHGGHVASQIFRLHVNDRQGLVERAEELMGSRAGYNDQKHIWRLPGAMGGAGRSIEFAALSEPGAWKKYQGRGKDLKAWDELPQFLRPWYKTVNLWARTTRPNQRVRIVSAGNPPMDAAGLWVIEEFAPWLDDKHPNPAKPGELRWVGVELTKDGKKVEDWVSADWSRTDAKTGRLILPRSRTFIPSTLEDNPDLAESGYASSLEGMTGELADLAAGKFKAQLDDHELQVIPTEWILAAQQRWQARYEAEHNARMTSVAADVGGGGPDEVAVQGLRTTFFDEPVVKQGVEVKNPAQMAGLIMAAARDDPQVVIDCGGGYGAGPAEHLESNDFLVVKFVGAKVSAATEKHGAHRRFANWKTEAVWRLREGLDPVNGDSIALPPVRKVVAELTSYRLKRRDRAVIELEAKEEQIKRLGYSPAVGDAIVMVWVEPDPVAQSLRAQRRRDGGRHGAIGRSPRPQRSRANAKAKYGPK